MSDSIDCLLPTASAASASLACFTSSSSCFHPHCPPAPSSVTQFLICLFSLVTSRPQPCVTVPNSDRQQFRSTSACPGPSQRPTSKVPWKYKAPSIVVFNGKLSGPGSDQALSLSTCITVSPDEGCRMRARSRSSRMQGWRGAAQYLLCSTVLYHHSSKS